MVFILKPERDLTLTKGWRPLNLINCVRKLWEKVVADKIQDFGGDLFHYLQFGSVRGRSAVDVLYRLVVRARRCLNVGGELAGALGMLRVSSRMWCGVRCWAVWMRWRDEGPVPIGMGVRLH